MFVSLLSRIEKAGQPFERIQYQIRCMLLGCVLIPISTSVRIKMSFTLATNLIGFLLDGVEFNTQENRFPFKKKKDEEENGKSFVSLRAFSLPLA